MIILGRFPAINLTGNEYSLFIKFKVFDQRLVDTVKDLPTRKYYPPEKVWEVPLQDIDRVVNSFGIENIELKNDIPEFVAYQQYTEQFQNGKMSIDELKDHYKNLKCEVDYDFKTAPKGHQIEAFNLALKEPAMFITDVMGLGKTKQAIDIMDYKHSIGEVRRVLIVCGINSIKYNWIGEIQKHSKNNCQVIDGTKKKRMEKLQQSWMFFYNIINAESLRSRKKEDDEDAPDDIIDWIEKAFESGMYDAIIVDEAHKFNNARSQQGSSLRRIQCKHKIALTGTPITKHVEKIWNILNWFGVVKETYWNFVKRYCILGGYSGWDVIGYQNTLELHQRLDRVQVRRTKDILDLPELTYQDSYVDLTNDERKEYRTIRNGIMMDIESGDVNFISPMTATLRLRQFTERAKIKALADLVTEIVDNGSACTIFSPFKENLYQLTELLRKCNPILITGDVKDTQERQNLVNDFQDGKYNVSIGTIQALGTGFTLTRSSYVIFLTKSWTNGDNDQARDRCHRIGSQKNVTVITMLVKDSIDERVEEVLENDRINIDKVVDGKITPRSSNKDLLSFLLEDK